MKASIISLGCKVNQSEGEVISDRLAEAGIAKALRGEHADIIIVNTCTVTGEADRKSRKIIYQAVKKKKGPKAIVAVTGCYAEVAASTLRDIPGVDLVVPQAEKDKLAGAVLRKIHYYSSEEAQADESRISGSRLAQKTRSELARTETISTSEAKESDPNNVEKGPDPKSTRTTNDVRRHRSYLKVQDGCNNRCAYCIVPDARGKPHGLPEAEILARAADLVAGGTKEIVLTGINLGKYKKDEHKENEEYKDHKEQKAQKEYKDDQVRHCEDFELVEKDAAISGLQKSTVEGGGNRPDEIASSSFDKLRTSRNDASVGLGSSNGLAGLIQKLLVIQGLARIRLSSIEPEDVTDELIKLLAEGDNGTGKIERLGDWEIEGAGDINLSPAKQAAISQAICQRTSNLPPDRQSYLCPHLHIPLQSGDDDTLKRMKRRYTTVGYGKIIDKVRAACPGVAITTDVIVGFPGETDDEFQNTYRFLEKAEMVRLHVFKYSKRPGTPAADMSGQVTAQIKAERSEALRELSGRLEANHRKKFIGRELDVLVEKTSGNLMTGTSENYLTVSFEGEASQVGQIVRVRLAE